MKDPAFYEKPHLPDSNFPLRVFKADVTEGNVFVSCHWHEQLELLYFTEGAAKVECSSIPIEVKAGDLIIVNSNELHYGLNLGNLMTYYCIIIDTSLFQSSFADICEAKYITPIAQNLILFKSKVSGDTSVLKCINEIINETKEMKIGYELAVKSAIFKLLVLLLRNHIEKILTPKEYDTRARNLDRLNKILQYIEDNYTENITINQLSEISNVSSFHFCHLFRKATGKTLSEHIKLLKGTQSRIIIKKFKYEYK